MELYHKYLNSSNKSNRCDKAYFNPCISFVKNNNLLNFECVNKQLFFHNQYLCGSISHLSSFALLLASNNNNLCKHNFIYIYASIALFGFCLLFFIFVILCERYSKRVKNFILGDIGFQNYEFRLRTLKRKSQKTPRSYSPQLSQRDFSPGF